MDTRQFRCDAQAMRGQVPPVSTNPGRILHRIPEVWRQQNLSTRVLVKRLAITPQELERQQSRCCDLLLSQLYKWQAALDVPVVELLIAPGQSLSPAIERRARLVKLMKSARSLQQLADFEPLRSLAEQLADELIEIMPELVGVDSWPVVGKRRTLDDVSALELRILPDSMLDRSRLPLPDND